MADLIGCPFNLLLQAIMQSRAMLALVAIVSVFAVAHGWVFLKSCSTEPTTFSACAPGLSNVALSACAANCSTWDINGP